MRTNILGEGLNSFDFFFFVSSSLYKLDCLQGFLRYGVSWDTDGEQVTSVLKWAFFDHPLIVKGPL